jgi:sortase (surface protein transpeptidase)
MGIAAHRDTYFSPLHAIHGNDIIALNTPTGTSRNAVTGTKIVSPSDVGVLARAPGARPDFGNLMLRHRSH